MFSAPDHHAGGGADQHDVERGAPGVEHRAHDLAQGVALAAVAEHQAQHDQDAGRIDGGPLDRNLEDFRIGDGDDQKRRSGSGNASRT